MKIFVAILALVACSYAEEWTVKTFKQVRDIDNECVRLLSLSPEQRVQVRRFQLYNVEAVWNHTLCSSEKIGVFSGDHGFYADRVAKQFLGHKNEEEAKEIADSCIDQFYRTNKKVSQSVYDVQLCIMDRSIGNSPQADATRRHGGIPTYNDVFSNK